MHGQFSMLYNAPTPQSQSPQGKDAQYDLMVRQPIKQTNQVQ